MQSAFSGKPASSARTSVPKAPRSLGQENAKAAAASLFALREGHPTWRILTLNCRCSPFFVLSVAKVARGPLGMKLDDQHSKAELLAQASHSAPSDAIPEEVDSRAGEESPEEAYYDSSAGHQVMRMHSGVESGPKVEEDPSWALAGTISGPMSSMDFLRSVAGARHMEDYSQADGRRVETATGSVLMSRLCSTMEEKVSGCTAKQRCARRAAVAAVLDPSRRVFSSKPTGWIAHRYRRVRQRDGD